MSGSGSLSYIGRSDRKLEAYFASMRLHIGYLRSLEDGPRVRAACVRYLQTYLSLFYPERPDIVRQMERLASDLGGRLTAPHLPWKYAWIQKTFGWSLAKKALILGPRCKWFVVRSWDRALAHAHAQGALAPDGE